MQVEWDKRIGMASVLTVVGTLVQIGVVIWVISAFKTSIVDQFTAVDVHFASQTAQIKRVEDGSNKRFETVHNSLAQAQADQSVQKERMSKVETAIAYISSQVARVEAKLDGGPTAPPLPAPTK